MSAAVRLTPPQVELLRDIVDKPMYVQTFSRWGKTAVALERNGLANVRGTGDGIQAEVTITADGLREARRRGLVSTAAVTEAATMAGRLRDPAFRDRAIRAGYVAGQVTDVTTLAGRLAVEEAAASTRLDGETYAIEGPVTVGEALPRAEPNQIDTILTDLHSVLDSARTCIALSSRDWSTDRDAAWLYGIFCGWTDDEYDALPLMADRHGWPPSEVTRLRRLRAAVEAFGREVQR